MQRQGPGSYQCNKVPGVLPPEVPTAAEDNEGDEEDGIGDIVGPDVFPDKALHLPDEGEHSHGGQSHGQLQGQHQEHLGREAAQSPASTAAHIPSPQGPPCG